MHVFVSNITHMLYIQTIVKFEEQNKSLKSNILLSCQLLFLSLFLYFLNCDAILQCTEWRSDFQHPLREAYEFRVCFYVFVYQKKDELLPLDLHCHRLLSLVCSVVTCA